jgi:hypothetical protein
MRAHVVVLHITVSAEDAAGYESIEKFSPEVLLLPYLRVLRRIADQSSHSSARLVSVGAPRLVVKLMGWAQTANDEAVMLQCLKLACSLTNRGNRAAQDAFLLEVASSRSSKFFASLMQIVRSCDVVFPTIKVRLTADVPLVC